MVLFFIFGLDIVYLRYGYLRYRGLFATPILVVVASVVKLALDCIRGLLFIHVCEGMRAAVSGRLKSVIAHAHKTPYVSHIP